MSVRLKHRATGAIARMPDARPPHITSATGGTLDSVVAPSAAGFNPLDLMYAALADCMALSLRAAAQQQQVIDRISSLSVRVTGTKAPDKPSRVAAMDIVCEIAGDLTDDEKAGLIDAAKKLCTVSNTLTSGVMITAKAGEAAFTEEHHAE